MVPARVAARDEQGKVRAKPEKFADHYTQARLFFESQSPVEQDHIANAFRFELSKVTVPAIRERTVAMLRNASAASVLLLRLMRAGAMGTIWLHADRAGTCM